MSEHEHYLGDGLYASFDGHQVKLRAPRDHGDDAVYLEPEVMHEFWQFVLRTGCFPLHGEMPSGDESQDAARHAKRRHVPN